MLSFVKHTIMLKEDAPIKNGLVDTVANLAPSNVLVSI